MISFPTLQCGVNEDSNLIAFQREHWEDATSITSYRLLSATLRSVGLPSSPEQHHDVYRMDGWAANDSGGGSTLATDHPLLLGGATRLLPEYRRTLLDAEDPYAAERGPSATPGEPQRLNCQLSAAQTGCDERRVSIMMGNNSPSVVLTMWKYQTSFSNTVLYHSNSRLSID